METQSQSEQPKEEPNIEDEAAPEEAALRPAQDTAEDAAPKAEDGAVVEDTTAPAAKAEDEDDDTAPLTADEFIDAGRQVAQTAKNAVLMPLYRLGRRYIRSATKASESFFDGVNDRQGKK